MIQKILDGFGLATVGDRTIAIPTNDIRVALGDQLPWSDPTDTLTILRVGFEPIDNEVCLRIEGEISYPLQLKKSPIPIPVVIGFTLQTVAILRYDRENSQLYSEATDIQIEKIEPFRGVPDIAVTIVSGALSGLVGYILQPGVRGISNGVRYIGNKLPTVPRPKVPNAISNFGSKITPNFAKRAGRWVGDHVTSTVKGISDTATNAAIGSTDWIKGIIVKGVNLFLSRTPLYSIPSEINGIPVKGLVHDIRTEGNQIVVHLIIDGNPTLKNWRIMALAGLGLTVLAGLGFWLY